MNIETLIREMHSDFCSGRTLVLAEKLESLLEFADIIEYHRPRLTKGAREVQSHDTIKRYSYVLAMEVMNFPSLP